MGSKKSVLKNNQTILDKNAKKTIKNVFTKVKRVFKQNIPDKPFERENEKAHKNDGSFSKSPVQLKDNSITPVYRIKDNKTGNRKVCDHLYYETVYGDEIINYLKEQPEKQCGSKSCTNINAADKTNSQSIQISEPSRRKNHRTVLTYDGDATERTDSVPYSCDNDLSDIDIDAPNQFNLDDEFCYLIGENFSVYQHPFTECLTLTLSEEILNYMENNQRFVTDDEVGGTANKDIVESWFQNSNTKMINRYDLLDKACSTNPASDIIGPDSLNVAFVKGMIYRRELYGPPIEQAGQAGPSQPPVPFGTEEYVITKRYNYGRDDPQTSMPTINKGFGCTCVQSWSNNFGLCPPTSSNHLPLSNQPLKKLDNSKNDIGPEKKVKPKNKLKLSGKNNKKMGPVKKPAVKKVISKKGNAKKRAPSAKPNSPASQKINSTKPAGAGKKLVKKGPKTVKNHMARRSSRVSLLPIESTEELPPIMENWKQSEKVSNNMIFGKNKPPVVRLSRISLIENLPIRKRSSIKIIEKDANTIKKLAKKNSSRRKKTSIESDDGELPSTSKSTFKTKVKQDVNADNSNKKILSEKEGPSNIRIGVSRPDDSGYDIMFSDKGDMKVTVEQVVSGKNRVFTYNSGNEAAIAVKDIEEDPREVKTAKTEPFQKINSKSPGMENSKSQKKKPIKLGVKIPKPLDKPKKITKGRSIDSGIMKSSFLVPNTPAESSFVHPSAPAAHSDKDDIANKQDHRRKDANISFEEHAKPHHNSEVRKLSPSMVQESLHPILEKFHPSDSGSPEEPKYTAEVQTDKCIMEGNKIECLTSIPHVKVVFDIPGTPGNKIETHTTKTKIASLPNDIHVDVGLDRIGPKFLDSISQKGVRYDSLVSNENVLTKDSQFTFRKMEQLDDGGHKIQPKISQYMQSMASVHSVESNVINTDLTDKKKQLNEPNKFKSKLYDANTLFEIKECLSKMKLELRNDCPCMASRFQDRLDNEDKNVRTDRVIIIRTKRRDGSQCSDDSDSSYQKETADRLQRLANEMLESNQKSKKPILTKEDVQNNEEKDEEQESHPDAEKIEHVEESNKKKLRKQHERQKSVRGSDDEALNHPEVSDRRYQANPPNDEESFYANRVRRKKTLSNENGRSVLSHPESTVMESDALMSKTIRKTALASFKNTQIEDSHVGFKNVTPETEVEEEELTLRMRNPTGIYFQGQNLLKRTITDNDSSSTSDEMDNSKIEISEPGAMNETIDTSEGFDERQGPSSMQEKDFYQSENWEMDHPNSSVPNHSPLREKNEQESTLGYKESVENMSHDGHVNFINVESSPSNSIHERPSIRPRSSTGIYYEGQNLLKANISDEDTLSQNYEEDYEENNISELDTKNEFRSKKEGYKNGVEPSSARDRGVYKMINVEHSVNFSNISSTQNDREPVRDSNGISEGTRSSNKKDSGRIKSDGAYKQLDGGEEGHKKTSTRESEKSVKKIENNREQADVEHELLTDRQRSFREKDYDDSLNHPELSERSLHISGQNGEEAYLQDKGRRKRIYREESGRPVWDHPDSSVTEIDALMTKTIRKGSIVQKLSNKKKIGGNGRIGLRKVGNFSPESKDNRPSLQTRSPTVLYREDGIKNKIKEHGTMKEKSRVKDEYDKHLKLPSVPHKNVYQNINVESSEDLIDGSCIGSMAQPVRDDVKQKKYETGSSKKRKSDEAKAGSSVNRPKIVTKHDSTMANTVRKSSFDHNALNENVSNDDGKVVYKSSGNSHFMSNGDRSSIRTTSSTRIFYDDQDLLKGTFVNEDSSSQMYEVDSNDKKLARKEGPSAVPREDVTENLSDGSYTESVGQGTQADAVQTISSETGSTEKPSEEEDHPEINKSDSPVVDHETSITGLIKDSDSDHKELDVSMPIENERVSDKSAGNSLSTSIEDRSSIQTTNSTRVFYDEPNLSKGPFVNEDSTSQMYEMGSSVNKMYGRGVKKEQLSRKIEYDKRLKTSSVRGKDIYQTSRNKNQIEAKGRSVIQPKSTVTKHGAVKNIKQTTLDYKVEDKNKPNEEGYFDFKYVGVNSQTKPNEDRTSIRTASSARDFNDEQKLFKGKIAEEVEDMPSHTNEEECDKYVSEPGASNEIVYRKEENVKGLKPSSLHDKVVPKTIIEEASENVSKVSSTRSGGQPRDYANRTPNEQSSTEKQHSRRNSISDEAYQSSDRQNKSKIRETERKKENGTKKELSPPGVAMRCCCGTVCPPRSADLQQRRSSSRNWDK